MHDLARHSREAVPASCTPRGNRRNTFHLTRLHAPGSHTTLQFARRNSTLRRSRVSPPASSCIALRTGLTAIFVLFLASHGSNQGGDSTTPPYRDCAQPRSSLLQSCDRICRLNSGLTGPISALRVLWRNHSTAIRRNVWRLQQDALRCVCYACANVRRG